MRRFTLFCLVCVLGTSAGILAAAGDDAAAAAADAPDPPRSLKAKTALKKYDRAVEKARLAYDQAVAAATKELNGELGAALKQAMQAGSLEEAKRIEAAQSARPAAAAAAGGRSGGGGDQRGMIGTWSVRYTNRTERTYTISADGRLSVEGGATTKLARPEAGGGLLLDFNDGKVERLRLVDGTMLLIEHFNRKSDLANGNFDVLGIGRRRS